VASQLLNDLEVEVKASDSFLLRDVLPGPAWAPFGPETGELRRAVDYVSVAMVEEENCPRAVLVALCVEGAVAVGLYAGWHLLHAIR
jgi:hypothetical protein